jgi:AraC-like DNA-binding protein
MMNEAIIQATTFSVPVASALVCMALMLFDAFKADGNRQERGLRLSLSLTCMVAAMCWTGVVLQAVHPRAFVNYRTVFLFALMTDQVLIYRCVHILTATGKGCRFNRLHFLLPAVLTAVSAAGDLTVPFEWRMDVIYGMGGGDLWSAAFYSLTGVVFIAYNIFYPVLGLLRIRRYRRSVEDYSADMQRTSLRWLFAIQALTLIIIPVPLTGLLLNVDVFSDFRFSMQGVLPSFFVYPVLCYNLLSDNYLIMSPDDDTPDRNTGIDPKRFSKYLCDRKPYLNPELRITDMAAHLNTNRSYMSEFINRTYGMNFSRFINRYRLEELDRLRISPPDKQFGKRDNMELVLMAGFRSYRSYLRARKREVREFSDKD